jgi:hypothetical protein
MATEIGNFDLEDRRDGQSIEIYAFGDLYGPYNVDDGDEIAINSSCE